jgi:hypothetical protein
MLLLHQLGDLPAARGSAAHREQETRNHHEFLAR